MTPLTPPASEQRVSPVQPFAEYRVIDPEGNRFDRSEQGSQPSADPPR